MNLETLPPDFIEAAPILEKLHKAGHAAYFVGGSVRDALLNRPIHDVDIATSAYPAEVKEIFKKTIDVGIEHGTVLVLSGKNQYEVTTFRTESKYTDFRRPDKVSFVSSLSEDLLRRDFTINALAMTGEGEIIDYFDGLSDLKAQKLRAVGKAEARFSEDALRIMRAMRFSATLDFDIEAETLSAMTSHANLLEKISVERSFIELDKLLTAKNWRKGLAILIETEAWRFLPDLDGRSLDDMTGGLYNPFGIGAGYDFTFKNSIQAWTYLAIRHEYNEIQIDWKKWKVSNDFIKAVENQLQTWSSGLTLETLYTYGLEAWLLEFDMERAEGYEVNDEELYALDRKLQIHHKSEIVIKGSDLLDLGYAPGPELGRILSDIETQIVNNNLLNNKKEIISYVEKTF